MHYSLLLCVFSLIYTVAHVHYKLM